MQIFREQLKLFTVKCILHAHAYRHLKIITKTQSSYNQTDAKLNLLNSAPS